MNGVRCHTNSESRARTAGARGLVSPPSFAQQRLWFLDQLDPAAAHVNNIPGAFRLTGPLLPEVLEASLRELCRRHESLRTSFGDRAGEPHQIVHGDAELSLPVIDLTALAAEDREEAARRLASEECRAPLELSVPPLWRVKLLRLGAEQHVLLVTMHHIISDGWSLEVFARELSALYAAGTRGRPAALAPLACQYADFAAWQREWLRGARTDEQLSYWRRELGGAPPALELPTDRQRPAVQTFNGATAFAALSKGLGDALASLSRREGATLFMTLLAAFQALLCRYTAQEDFAVGVPVAGRNRIEIEGLIGFFVNTLALRCDLTGDPTFAELLARVRESALGAYDHQDLPFERLVEELQPERSLSHTPIFQVMFQLSHPPGELCAGDLKIEEFEFDSRAAKFDMSLEMIQRPEGLKARLVYNTDLFDAVTISRLLGHYQTLLKGVVTNPRQRLSALPLLTDAERREITVDWNRTATGYPRSHTVQQLFEEQVARTPDAVAVVYEGGSLTYARLNERANRLAHRLRASGAGAGGRVGVFAERSPEMIEALLAVLKAGGAYVPLDPDYPPDRLAFMIADASVSVILTQGRLRGRLPRAHGAEVIPIDSGWGVGEGAANPPPAGSAESTAYIIYTSGSTGNPKGVLTPHRGVVRLVKATNYARLDADEVFLQFAPLSFDASTFEIWGSLLNGARLVLMPPGPASLEELGAHVRRSGVTTLWLTAGLFRQMAEAQPDSLKGLRQLLVGGDVVSAAHVRKLLADFRGVIINGYGPTENTTFTCCHPVRAGGPIPAPVPIGRPVSNTRVYVLDRNLQPVPAGVAGELHIGGDGLAQGYLNAPDLTLEKFIPDPFSDDVAALLYKSGDRARHLADGTIEFLGRLDRQVKVRGFRVEPAEVEAALSEYAGVREVAVVVHEGDAGDQRLIAYLVAAAGAPPSFVEELRCFAKGRLPKYLVPSAFLLVDSIPLTAHGKIERGALPAAAVAAGSPSASPPTTKVEWRLAGIWSELLGVSSPGVHDDFFDLGGHSLLATRLVSRVREAFGVSLPLRQLFENPTIASLAALIGVESGAEAQAPPRAPVSSLLLIPVQPDGTRVPFFLVPGGGGGERELINYAPLLRSLGTDQPCYGFNADAVNVPAEGESVEGLARALVWEIRALQPEGPYLLGGECVGGIVAFEAARQLRAAGQRVGLLVLLDTEMPNLSVSLRYRVSSAHQSVFGRARWYFNDLSRLDIAGWTPYALDKSRKAWARVRSAIGRKDSEGAADPLTRRQSSGQSYAETLLRYRPRPYDGAITLLISEDLYSRGSVQAWSEVASGGAEVHVVPGDHTTYLRDHVRVLAERLGACLDRAQPDTWSRAGAPARLSQSAGG